MAAEIAGADRPHHRDEVIGLRDRIVARMEEVVGAAHHPGALHPGPVRVEVGIGVPGALGRLHDGEAAARTGDLAPVRCSAGSARCRDPGSSCCPGRWSTPPRRGQGAVGRLAALRATSGEREEPDERQEATKQERTHRAASLRNIHSGSRRERDSEDRLKEGAKAYPRPGAPRSTWITGSRRATLRVVERHGPVVGRLVRSRGPCRR